MEPIFFDFETDTDEERKVYLLAFRVDDKTYQYVCDPKLEAASNKSGLELTGPEAACETLLSLKNGLKRPIACYTHHDATVLRQLFPALKFEYLDMHKVAKRWINTRHLPEYQANAAYNRGIRVRGGAVDRWAFLSIATWAGIQPPSMYGRGKTLSRLRAVKSGLRRTDGRYEGLTPTQQRKWGWAVQHNQFDVEGLQELYRRIQSELQNSELKALIKQSMRSLPVAAMAS